jgi:hypothetical protein
VAVRPACSVVLATLAFLAAGPVPVALAHGPCDCLFPQVAEAGTEVRITGGPAAEEAGRSGWPVYRVIFNPQPALMGAAAYMGGAYNPAEPTLVFKLAPQRKTTRNGSFIAPRVSPGVYFVAIYDGSEGGSHFTWDYLHLFKPMPAQETSPHQWRAAMEEAISVAPSETYERQGASGSAPTPSIAAPEPEDQTGGSRVVLFGVVTIAVAAGAFAAGAFWRTRRQARW